MKQQRCFNCTAHCTELKSKHTYDDGSKVRYCGK